MNGYYKQFREDLEEPLFTSGKYDNFHAYSYLQAIAQYHQSSIAINSKFKIDLQERELFTSRNKLAYIFNWNEHKVSRFLKQLQDNGYIECEQIGKYGTKIKMLKYEREQANEQAEPSIYKGLQGVGEQASEQAPSKQTSKQTSKQNSVFMRDCENRASKQASKQVSNNIQESIKNNSVCIENTKKQPVGKMIFSEEELKELINNYGESKVKRVIAKAERYYCSVNESILEPMKVFKKFAASDKGEPKRGDTHQKTKKSNNSFNNFDQRNYDMNELERKLLAY